MKKTQKLSLTLNKQVIEQLDRQQAENIKGGEDFLSLWGSNCRSTNPKYTCCEGESSVDPGACTSTGTGTQTMLCCTY
ncbi:MAG: class I lanthipeptide [Lewinellaceae bacterium]|jgi:hypothetical protein|nr:class I lanthipeptide [Lewinellaceae bacterium]